MLKSLAFLFKEMTKNLIDRLCIEKAKEVFISKKIDDIEIGTIF